MTVHKLRQIEMKNADRRLRGIYWGVLSSDLTTGLSQTERVWSAFVLVTFFEVRLELIVGIAFL
jgi:hypothetical protein